MDSVTAGLTARTADGQARSIALRAMPVSADLPTAVVSYQSKGTLLVIGKEQDALHLAEELRTKLRCAVLVTAAETKVVKLGTKKARRDGPGRKESAPDGVAFLHGRLEALEGHLGEFRATLATPKGGVNLARELGFGQEYFDLVLDLGAPPQIQRDTPPPGYYAPGKNKGALQRALTELPELVGEFEKPRYFNYDPDICAHGNSGLKGCTRCLEVCPTLAIRSTGDKIEVDPHLCQGGGSCATACPTGAITYTYPAVSDLLVRLRTLLRAYREAGGTQPSILFHDVESGRLMLASIAAQLPEQVLPFEVEEVGSVGMDVWLAACAYGASHVLLLAPPAVTSSVRRELRAQIGFTGAILAGMGYAGERVRLLEVDGHEAAAEALGALSAQPAIRPSGFAAVDEKRTNIRLAVDHLYGQASAHPAFVPLPAGAPFGQILVDRKGCTLCMACASVCPHSAVSAGGDSPQLLFDEWNCVQCGLCETACPEHVIKLEPRFLYDPEMRRTTRTLNEDEPFCCIVCGKAFASRSMLTRMQEKLKGHWMFQNPEALRRVQMCDDCRVKDMYISEGLINVHNKPPGPQ